jgi:hypothetical protein
MYGNKINLAVLSGNANLFGDRYIGVDGSVEEIEFSDARGRRRPMPKKRGAQRKRSGRLQNFARGIGIDPKASQERRDMRRKKQTQQNQLDRQNMALQQQALTVAANQPDPSTSAAPIMQTRPLEESIQQSGWKSLKGWQKGLIIGVGLAAIGTGVYLFVKSKKAK